MTSITSTSFVRMGAAPPPRRNAVSASSRVAPVARFGAGVTRENTIVYVNIDKGHIEYLDRDGFFTQPADSIKQIQTAKMTLGLVNVTPRFFFIGQDPKSSYEKRPDINKLIETLRALKAEDPQVKVFVLTSDRREQTLLQSLAYVTVVPPLAPGNMIHPYIREHITDPIKALLKSEK